MESSNAVCAQGFLGPSSSQSAQQCIFEPSLERRTAQRGGAARWAATSTGAQEDLPPLREADMTVCLWAAWPCSGTGTSRFSRGDTLADQRGQMLRRAEGMHRAPFWPCRAPSRHSGAPYRPGHAERHPGT